MAVFGALANCALNRVILDHDVLHPVQGLQRGAFDDLLLAIQVGQDRTPHGARNRLDTLVAASLDEGTQIDGIADLDEESAVGREEGGDLGQVRRSRLSAVEEVEEAATRPRPLPPEECEGNERNLAIRVPDRAHRLLEEIELAGALLGHSATGEQPAAQTGRAQEQEHRLATLGNLPRFCARFRVFENLWRSAPAAQRDA